ncbi:glycosyltransferase family 2 protein [Candidatus Microgenomates bacterium]|nr:glycosyltransferase family 2 protein [Candidatus Microgenomates bacterium]
MSKERPSISVFFPFLNDWGTVGSLVALAAGTVSKLTEDWEVVVINDGSRREDREALKLIVDMINSQNSKSKIQMTNQTQNSKLKTQNNIKIITHEKNRGYGGALRSGFAAAKKDLIFYTDCDGQYDPRELIKLYELMVKGGKNNKREIGMVNGYKIKRHDPWYRTVAGRIYHHFVKFAFSLPIRDTDCDFRLIRKKVFNQVKLFENTGTICVELVKKIDHFGYRIAEVPVHHFWRTSGKSQFFNFNRLFQTAVNLGKLWWKLMVVKSEK